MPIFGLTNGLIPIVAYNYGARNRSRIKEAFLTCVVTAMSIMLVGTIVFHVATEPLLYLFDATPEIIEIGKPALRIVSLCFVFAGFGISGGSVFQALGNGVYSLIVSFTRQILFIIPAAYLLSLTGKLNLVWFSFPIAEISSVFLTVFFLLRIFKKKLNF